MPDTLNLMFASSIALNLAIVFMAGPLATAFLWLVKKGHSAEEQERHLGGVLPEPAVEFSRKTVIKTLVLSGIINIVATVLIRAFMVPAHQ